MIQNKNFTYNGIINILETFANAHLDIRRFASEDEDQMSEITSKNNAFPMVFVAPEVNTYDQTVNTVSLKIFVYDRLLKDRTNVTDLRSKTGQIVNDLDVWLRNEDELPIEITEITTAYPFSSELMTDVTGWWFGITIDVPTSSLCVIPFEGTPVISGWTCDIEYTNKALTCTTLVDCPTIVDLDDRVTALENGSGGGGLTCEGLASCEVITTIITDIIDLQNKELWTVELIDALTTNIYAPFALQITSVDQIVNTATITILVEGLPYALGNTINQGDNIVVASDLPVVINLNILK